VYISGSDGAFKAKGTGTSGINIPGTPQLQKLKGELVLPIVNKEQLDHLSEKMTSLKETRSAIVS